MQPGMLLPALTARTIVARSIRINEEGHYGKAVAPMRVLCCLTASRLIGNDKRCAHLAKSPQALLPGEKTERLVIGILGGVPGIGRDVNKVTVFHLKTLVPDDLISPAAQVVLHRITLDQGTLLPGRHMNHEQAERVYVKSQLRTNDHML